MDEDNRTVTQDVSARRTRDMEINLVPPRVGAPAQSAVAEARDGARRKAALVRMLMLRRGSPR